MDEVKHNMILIWMLHGFGCVIAIMTLSSIPPGYPILMLVNYGVLVFNVVATIFWGVWYFRFIRDHRVSDE